jgi:hypothetical protein
VVDCGAADWMWGLSGEAKGKFTFFLCRALSTCHFSLIPHRPSLELEKSLHLAFYESINISLESITKYMMQSKC